MIGGENSLKDIGPISRSSAMSEKLESTTSNPSISSVPESRAKTFQSRENEQGSKENVQDSFTSLRESLRSFDPLGSYSRMFPDYSVRTKEETSRRFCKFSWLSAGMGFRGACLTQDFSEYPNDVVEYSLSDILEPHVHRRFYLSPKAA